MSLTTYVLRHWFEPGYRGGERPAGGDVVVVLELKRTDEAGTRRDAPGSPWR